jgi:hypothetical protein
MKRLSLVLAGLSLAALLAQPAAAQQRQHKRDYQWYWGGQAGAFYYQTGKQGYYFDPIIGGHWVITAKKTALYVAYEQAVFLTDAEAAIVDPSSVGCSSGTGCRDVTFSDMRRIMFGVLAYPTRTFTEPYFGGGFAMMQVLNPTVDCTNCVTQSEAFEAQSRAQDASSKAFFWLMAGIQINRGKLSLFGHYVLTSAAANFLIQGTTHTFQGGARMSFGTAKEGIGGDRN